MIFPTNITQIFSYETEIFTVCIEATKSVVSKSFSKLLFYQFTVMVYIVFS
jgi:hypothetical protein